MYPVPSTVLIVLGIILVLCSIAAGRNKAALASLLTIGGLSLIAGVIMVLIPTPVPPAPDTIVVAEEVVDDMPPPPPIRRRRRVPAKPILKTPSMPSTPTQPVKPTTLAAVGDVTLSPAPSPSPRVTWSDGDDSSSGLEEVVEFEVVDSPAGIAGRSVVVKPAHKPKKVPAVPKRYRAGYVSASAPTDELPSLESTFNPVPIPPSVGGAVYYKPPSKYPTVGEIAEERQAFYSRPETPDIDRHRRIGQLREIALTLKPERSGNFIPMQ
jgi:hypothetical protein